MGIYTAGGDRPGSCAGETGLCEQKCCKGSNNRKLRSSVPFGSLIWQDSACEQETKWGRKVRRHRGAGSWISSKCSRNPANTGRKCWPTNMVTIWRSRSKLTPVSHCRAWRERIVAPTILDTSIRKDILLSRVAGFKMVESFKIHFINAFPLLCPQIYWDPTLYISYVCLVRIWSQKE